MSHIQSVDNETFQHVVLDAKHWVLVDFWAPWCQPCKRMLPTLEAFAQENEQTKVVKVNVDDCREIAAEYGIRGIPTLLLFNQGELIATRVGELSKSELEDFIHEHK